MSRPPLDERSTLWRPTLLTDRRSVLGLMGALAMPGVAQAWTHGSAATYPLGVINAGSQTVYNLQFGTNSGVNAPLLYTPTSPQPGGLPSGVSISSGTNLLFNSASPITFNNYDCTGYTLFFDGASTVVNATNNLLTLPPPAGGNNLIATIGFSTAGPQVSLTNCTIDGSGNTGTFYGASCLFSSTSGAPVGKFTARYCRWIGCGLEAMELSVQTDIQWSLLGASGWLATAGQHINIGHFLQANHVFSNNLVNMTTSQIIAQGPEGIFCQAEFGNIVMTAENNVFLGFDQYGSGGAGRNSITNSFGADNGGTGGNTAVINLNNNCVEKGVFGTYYGVGTGGTINGQGSGFDTLTGAAA